MRIVKFCNDNVFSPKVFLNYAVIVFRSRKYRAVILTGAYINTQKISKIIARTLDSYDGEKDEQINGSIWNEYFGNQSGMTTNEKGRIKFGDAVYIIGRYLTNLTQKAFNAFCEELGIGEIDEKGNISEYDNEGKISLYSKYDDDGNLLSTISYDSEGKKSSVKEFDKEGKITKYIVYNENETAQLSFTYEYDSKGNLSKRRCHYSNGNLNELTIYNDKGDILSITTYDPYEAGKKLNTRYLDEQRETQKIVVWNPDETKDYEIFFNTDYSTNTIFYNDNGTKSLVENRDNEGNITRTYYTNNGKTKTKTEVYNKETELWTVTKYDPRGNIISEETSPMALDGILEESAQVNQGDCYLMSSINAIRGASGGQEYLSSLIKNNGDGSYTITLPGAKIAANGLLKDGIPKEKMYITGEYTFTPKEMKEIKSKERTGYSIGDDDVILLEAAFEKYRIEVKQTMDKNNLKENKYKAGREIGNEENNPLEGGYEHDAIFILTGQQSEIYNINKRNHWLGWGKEIDPHAHKYEKNPRTDNNQNPSFKGVSSKPSKHTTVDDIDTEERTDNIEIKDKGTTRGWLKKLLRKIKKDRRNNTNKYIATTSFNTKGGGEHAYTIKDVTEDSVILINPWHPDKTITMDIQEFIRTTTGVTLAEMPKKAA